MMYLRRNVIKYSKLVSVSLIYNSRHFCKSLKECDAELWNLLRKEKIRQKTSLALIASENFTSKSVLDCIGSSLTNKYSEGYPHARYYGGNEIVDEVEILAQTRLLNLFDLKQQNDSRDWGVNVQPYSGSPANFAVYTALLKPGDRLMGLHLPDGGHLTHGFATESKKISATSIFFESVPYRLNPATELIDYDALQKDALKFRPKLIIAGTTAYPRVLDYKRFREICDSIGAVLHADMAHISGLVASKVIPSPFDFADVVTSTTHKTLRGPRSGVIFYRKKCLNDGKDPNLDDLESRINNAVFPGLQGGPHENVIAGVAAMALEASTLEFKNYASQVLSNAKSLANSLLSRGLHLLTGGTDIHYVLVDLTRSKQTSKSKLGRGDGARVQFVADLVGISLNKNTVPGDSSAQQPSGLRLGTPALTTRGFKEQDFDVVAMFVDELLEITSIAKSASSNFKTFKLLLNSDQTILKRIKRLRSDIADFAIKFPMPGNDDI